MNEFKKLTGLSYSNVMVFPAGHCTSGNTICIREYGFLATSNSNITPLGNDKLTDLYSLLLPANLHYYRFPLLKRYYTGTAKYIIDLNLFFEKPMLFYTHQDYFYKNIKHFNIDAKYVNEKTGNNIEWVNLEELTTNLYRERMRLDGAYDLLLMCKKVSIRNIRRRKSYIT